MILDMTTVSSRNLSDQHNGEETTFTSKNPTADVSSVTTPVMGETSERTQCEYPFVKSVECQKHLLYERY